MNEIHKELELQIGNALMRRNVSFIVMNKYTHDKLLEIHNTISTCRIDKMTRYRGLDVLISEDVNDVKFKLGYDEM